MRPQSRPPVTLLALCVAIAAASPATGAEPQQAGEALPPPVLQAMRSVVGVEVREVSRIPVFRRGRFQREEVEGMGAGSGVVIGRDGLVITNAHVVAGSEEVRVRLGSGREVDARVLSVDEPSDLALLRLLGAAPPPISVVGEEPPAGSRAFVIGNRDDRGLEVGWARIGAHRRVRIGARPLEFWSQIDAYVGPGDSGGAVVDGAGRLIGVPSLQILYADPGRLPRQTAGLFIPAAHVSRSLRKMLGGPRAIWPWIGIVLDDPLISAGEGRSARPGTGARIRSVVPGGPADGAGFRPGDHILAIDGRATPDDFAALDAVLDLVPDRSVTVEVERDGSIHSFTVTAGIRPADPRPDALDDFTLHTGLRLQARTRGDRGAVLSYSAMTDEARGSMPEFEAELFERGAILGSLLPGQDALAGRAARETIDSLEELSALLNRCFVNEQFVALAHWSDRGGGSLDRAHVHRKIYPVVL